MTNTTRSLLESAVTSSTSSGTLSASSAVPPAGHSYDLYTNKVVTAAFDYYVPGTDGELLRQWHLTRLGNIGAVWKDYTGKGVSVGIVDSGTQSAHWDLDGNYDASKYVVVDGVTYSGEVNGDSGPHGTSVAGLIAAERNGRGGVGVAYDAKVTGVNIFDQTSPIFVNGSNLPAFYEALRQTSGFDVVNHSWGNSNANVAIGYSRAQPGTFAFNAAAALSYVAETGRGGLGTISVQAGGNASRDHQSDGMKTDRHSVTVAAYREADGAASNYSSHGAHILVAGPSSDSLSLSGSGLTTTDMLGTAGYNLTADPTAAADYTDQFGGTSGATPIVTGVVSLILDANEGLGWRDVKNILAASAKMPVAFETGPVVYQYVSADASVVARMNEGSFHLTGPDANWNGGGMHYSQDYGYGAVDAYNAVRMAEVWSLFGGAKVSSNEVDLSTGVVPVNVTAQTDVIRTELTNVEFARDFGAAPAEFKFDVNGKVDVEHIDLKIDFRQSVDQYTFGKYDGSADAELFGAQLKLIAPDGTESFVSVDGVPIGGSANQSFVFGFAGFRGAETSGTWTLQFLSYDSEFTLFGLDTKYDTKFTIKSLKMDMFGSSPSSDDVYTYTHEFFDMTRIAGEEAGRRTLSDTNGGVDWINAAAVADNVNASLVAGSTVTFGGKDAFTIASGTAIENLVTGDGADRLFGNAFDNKLYGMRGNDWLNGGAGNDTLFGGAGADVFAFDTAGVSGKDQILDWSLGDRIATSKQLRGADQNGLVTIDSSALVLLDNSARGDTAELVDHGGAVLQAMGKTDGYWWYSWVSGGSADFVDGHVTELALGQTGRGANDAAHAAISSHFPGAELFADAGGATAQHTAFFLYDTMGDSMASGVQIAA